MAREVLQFDKERTSTLLRAARVEYSSAATGAAAAGKATAAKSEKRALATEEVFILMLISEWVIE